VTEMYKAKRRDKKQNKKIALTLS